MRLRARVGWWIAGAALVVGLVAGVWWLLAKDSGAHGADIATVLGLPVALVGLIVSLTLGRLGLGGAAQASAPSAPLSLVDKIESLRAALASSGRLITEINAELELQATALERIKAEAQENQRLADLNKDEAEAVRKLFEVTIEGAQAKAERVGGRKQWQLFGAGLFASVPLGVIANFAYEAVKARH